MFVSPFGKQMVETRRASKNENEVVLTSETFVLYQNRKTQDFVETKRNKTKNLCHISFLLEKNEERKDQYKTHGTRMTDWIE